LSNSVLSIGYNGLNNTLTIQNGGQGVNANGYIGYNSGSSNNTVIVAGSGSVWSNSSLYIGRSGSSNALNISNSGRVFTYWDTDIGSSGGASNNSVLVTDAGSLLTSRDRLRVGPAGALNKLGNLR
jgi:T5SS/PEP-CTERM-associated repeat protein